jgi:hypothetical protein
VVKKGKKDTKAAKAEAGREPRAVRQPKRPPGARYRSPDLPLEHIPTSF